jgi:vacuolar-type H+-ATPase subunit E/Vma4
MTDRITSEAQLRANRKYKEKVKQIKFEIFPTELDILEHLQKQPYKATYIKDLIRADMEKSKEEA